MEIVTITDDERELFRTRVLTQYNCAAPLIAGEAL